MATLTVWKFDDPDGAERVRDKIIALQKEDMIGIHDAVVVSWPADKKKPKTSQLESETGAGIRGGAFWGFLLGVFFFVPFFGMAVGAAVGGLSRSLHDLGISDDFIDEVRKNVTPGTSALFLLTSGTMVDRVKEELRGEHMQLGRARMCV
jgi:uncharacterized membrane protein